MVSDNASDDDTASVVASFRDPRLVYRPLERNIGRAANFNRLIDLAETPFVVLMGDDDQLHPEHLSRTVEALKRCPTAGLVHTGCTIVDISGSHLVSHHRLIETRRPALVESGAKFLERSMRSGWTVCFPSATFRREALIGGGGLRPEDGTIDDIPLLMRIATDWDLAYLNLPLVAVTAHSDASSSSLGSFTPNGFRVSRSLPDMLYDRRRQFLDEADLPDARGGTTRPDRREDVSAGCARLPLHAREDGRWSADDLQGSRQGDPPRSSPWARSHDRSVRHRPAGRPSPPRCAPAASATRRRIDR